MTQVEKTADRMLSLYRDADASGASARSSWAPPGEQSSSDGDRSSIADPLETLAIVSSVRLADERLEEHRLAIIERALTSARVASDALHAWVAQSLSEYRGSRTTWDLQSTGSRLRCALAHLDSVLRESATQLSALVPHVEDRSIADGVANPSAAAQRRNGTATVPAASVPRYQPRRMT